MRPGIARQRGTRPARWSANRDPSSPAERLTGDPGAILLREVLENSGIAGWITDRLTDPQRPQDVTHDLASLLRTAILLASQG
ncbi:hypothetical protein GCM10008966_34080 [Rhodovulum strictum]|uniref:Transposase DDE domain-containing protein n=1 Tax=Rhodovulum strictum TaxID=58314 RepID=A0A844BPM6_9RHOB|nr:hypothetical protein [Rhodovulum strictum]